MIGVPRLLRLLSLLLTATIVAHPAVAAGSGQGVAIDNAATTKGIVSPEAFFGFRMGADGKLANWEQIERYFSNVAEASDRVALTSLGATTEGRQYIAAIISAPENLARLEQIRQQNLRLSDPRTLPPEAASAAFDDQPAVLLIGASIHATEIGATQAANELLYELATSTSPRVLSALHSLVILLMPSLNPDGHALVVDWFERNRGTPFEASPMPWLYHKYAGHDINRDAFMLNLVENQRLADFLYRVWHPQVFLTMHQMDQRGPRLFVPPNYDPIDPNYDPLIWRTAGLLGNAMALELERDGQSGVVQNAMWDYYWPGYEDSAPIGHNTVCLLTEVASARLAYPIDIRPEELSGSFRGLLDYRPQVNFPNPWPGGRWRLRDIVEYDLSAVHGLLDGAARYRRELVENFYTMGRRAIERGAEGSPFAFVVSPVQHDPYATSALVKLLLGGGVEVQQAIQPFRADGRDYPAGTQIILMAQPYRAYAKTLLERQDYPVRRLIPGGEPERPYDATAWTLPYQMGVAMDEIKQPFEVPPISRVEKALVPAGRISGDPRPSYYVLDVRGNGGALAINRLQAAGLPLAWSLTPLDASGTRLPAGSVILPASAKTRAALDRVTKSLGLNAIGSRGRTPGGTVPVGRPRIGLYKPWIENIDEGWTRWLLEQYEFPYVSLTDEEMRAGSLSNRVDVIILPDAPPERLFSGNAPGVLPEAYVGGLGTAGIVALQTFVKNGGTIVCLDSACGLLIDALALPVNDVVKGLSTEKFFCPGSILRLTLDPTQPLAFGMPEQTAAFFTMSSAYDLPTAREPNHERTSTDGGEGTVVARSVGWYGSGNPLMSGWLLGESMIAEKAAIAEARVGRGRVVLLGFPVQYRAQSHASFRLLFNAFYSYTPATPRRSGSR